MGITTHNPDTLDFPATMTNMRSGTYKNETKLYILME